ncbi:hypothetical protein ACH47B_26105 [Rhodococcus sp. NPDC019627]|uniref:Uncharacterized protein n=1 Tax=Rhodococcus oxybenzonivorans TaxID=1990687 RepID=A0A2S2BV69_9NOCA|nr:MULTISPECIES: hypothetical protein [Rhodococcus]AWK72483.1 hypothetical protein CBI38_13735 [Rhodococcus oxybenzonivorans]MDV7351508.1 hypothetical protein [Rhodococcus oxybenzonivorans]QHE69382.1 hypothetical protein GFS60_02948 [Rhodococcus sp. WAY2]QTJ64441.1 hypothetical protein HYG77_01725 [Rhodococcus sp. ZPP]
MHSSALDRDTLPPESRRSIVAAKADFGNVALASFVCLVSGVGSGVLTDSLLVGASVGLIVLLATALSVAAV